jgi:NADH-quinone oxidoreductase subunit L
MVLPMVVLGIAALVSGYLASPQWAGPAQGFRLLGVPTHWITDFLRSGLEKAMPPGVGHLVAPGFSLWLAAVSTGIALAGMALATALYLRRRQAAKRDPLEAAQPIYTVLSHRYYVDALYEDVIVRRGVYRGLAGAVDRLDSKFVDGVVDTIGWVFRNIGRAIAQAQTGQVQFYAVVITLGSVLILVGYLVSRW